MSLLSRRRSGDWHVREYELVAAPTTLPMFDGRPLRVWAYDGQVPGPILRVRLGERLRVRFTNRLPDDTTVHWHGVRVPNGMDGAPGVTQPPVRPDESFVYEFIPKDAGTFWFHPHLRSSEQVEREETELVDRLGDGVRAKASVEARSTSDASGTSEPTKTAGLSQAMGGWRTIVPSRVRSSGRGPCRRTDLPPAPRTR